MTYARNSLEIFSIRMDIFQLWVHLTDFLAKSLIPHSVSDAN